MYALGELAWNIGNEKRGKLFSRRKKRVEYKLVYGSTRGDARDQRRLSLT